MSYNHIAELCHILHHSLRDSSFSIAQWSRNIVIWIQLHHISAIKLHFLNKYAHFHFASGYEEEVSEVQKMEYLEKYIFPAH